MKLMPKAGAEWRKAVVAFSQGIEVAPDDASALNNLAWYLATCREPLVRDPERAVALASRAVQLNAGNADAWNTLGVAHYRAGDCKTAIAALEKATQLSNGGDGTDWFFLGMAQWQVGDMDKAHTCYDKAVQWTDRNEPKRPGTPSLPRRGRGFAQGRRSAETEPE